MIGKKPLETRFDKIDGFIIAYDGTEPEKYDAIYNRVRYLVSIKSGITYFSSYYFAESYVGSYGSLPIKNIDFQ